MTSKTLTQAETTDWEDAGERGDTYRARVREGFADRYPTGTSVEVYSHDGITLDAWTVER